MGQPIIEQLQRDGLRIESFITTNASKAQAIQSLALPSVPTLMRQFTWS
jgi:hypothetical protein